MFAIYAKNTIFDANLAQRRISIGNDAIKYVIETYALIRSSTLLLLSSWALNPRQHILLPYRLKGNWRKRTRRISRIKDLVLAIPSRRASYAVVISIIVTTFLKISPFYTERYLGQVPKKIIYKNEPLYGTSRPGSIKTKNGRDETVS